MKTLLFLACSFGLSVVVQAQSVGPSILNAAGNSQLLNGHTYEWSVGEMAVVSTFVSPGLVVTQGVLQPVIKANGVGTVPVKLAQLKVYPNPVLDDGQLYLNPSFPTGGKLTYQLVDAAGKTILRETSALQTGKELQTVSMSIFAAGQYTLSVEWQDASGKSAAAYKIQKTH